MAQDFLKRLLESNNLNPFDTNLRASLKSSVSTSSWTKHLAKKILDALTDALSHDWKPGEAVKRASDMALDAAMEAFETIDIFRREHPVAFWTLIAIGVLAIMAPWILPALGFGGLGPIQGTFAALWQSQYAGFVPKGSLFSFLQRLGMIWKVAVCKL